MNPNMIEWTTSDAPRHPPRPHFSLVPNPDPFGHENWMEYLPDSHEDNEKWRRKTGAVIAKHLGHKDTDTTAYWMDGLPDGYALFRHHKTMPEGKQDRNDTYLYGSPKGRFRSPDEFYMHAIWLMDGKPPNSCPCKCCTGGWGSSQISINAKYGLPGQQVPPERKHRRTGAA